MAENWRGMDKKNKTCYKILEVLKADVWVQTNKPTRKIKTEICAGWGRRGG